MNTSCTYTLCRSSTWAVAALLGGLLGACAHDGAAPAGTSLYQRRLEIVDTPKQQAAAPTVAPVPAGASAASPVAVAVPAAGGATVPAAPAAVAAMPAAPAKAASSPGLLQGLIEKLGPPSGRPLNEATQLKAPGYGITVPSEKAKAAAAAASAASR